MNNRILLAVSAVLMSAAMQSIGSTNEAAAETTAAINLPAGDLDAALKALARHTGVQLLYDRQSVEGIRTKGVHGARTAEEAIEELLKGTQLSMKADASGAFLISQRVEGMEGETASHIRLAQAGTDSGQPDGSTEESNPRRGESGLAEVVVTGVRERGYRSKTQSAAMFGEQSILDTPFQVSAFPIELLQDQQVRTLFHVAKNDASTGTGNNSGGVGFYDSVSIRGFTLGNESGYYREGAVFPNNAQMPFENKAAVEIVKGLTALRYGFTAPGGIVNYVLKRPTESTYRFIDVFGDSNGGYGVHLDLGGKLGEDLGIRFNAVKAHEDQFIRSVNGKREMISLFLSWTPTDRLLVEADAEYQYRDTELGQNIDYDAFDPAEFTRAEIRDFLGRIDRRVYIGEDWTRFPTRTFMGSVRMVYELNPSWKLRLNAQKAEVWRNQAGFYWVANSMRPNGDYQVYLWRSPDQEFSPSTVEATVSGNLATGAIRHDLVVGAIRIDHPYRYPDGAFVLAGTKNIFDPAVHIENPNPPVGDSVLKQSLNQFGAFMTDYVRVTDRLNVFAGVRYTKPKFESFFGPGNSRDWLYEKSALTPSGGVIFKPRPNISLYASYAEGLEVGGQAPPGTVNFGQVQSPLKSHQYELGVKTDFADGATLSAALFEIDKGLELINDENRFVQDGRQVHRGVEASLAGQLTPDLRLIASAQYLEAEMRKTNGGALDGKRPYNVPKLKANVYANWRLPVQRDLSVNAGVFYAGERFVDTANTFAIDSYLRFDAGLIYGFDLRQTKAKLRLIVENLTDKNYFSGTQQGFLMYGEPRTFRLSLSTSY